jgi:alginate O-acetyltransferase complex protein AlgI
MLFNSEVFLFAFLPLTYAAFWLLRGRNPRFALLTVASYVFYGYWDYRFCALMAFTTAISFTSGMALGRAEGPGRRRFLATFPIVVDLAVLGFFKYANFGAQTATGLASTLGLRVDVPTLNIVLPVGISFYTFHTITYIVDTYRRVIVPTRNPLEFACYVSLFSQLVAGPIVRFRQIEPDLARIDRAEERRDVERGLSFFAIGMAQKVLVADTIASIIDPALSRPTALSTADAWLCMLGYTYQIYFDFAGYSNMAVGLGHLFGITIPQNFNSPYRATDPADFWRRWHISLSSFLRDYVYIPLGGNRHGSLVTYRNLAITMLLGGLWHGANWTFVCWGAYHGVLLMFYRRFGRVWDVFPALARRAAMFLLVVLGWVLFRAGSFTDAAVVYGAMFSWRPGLAIAGAGVLVGALLVAAMLAHRIPEPFEMRHTWDLRRALLKGSAFAASLGVIVAGHYSPFLYFQF